MACEEFGITPTATVETGLQELVDFEVVEMKSLLEFGVVNLPAENLEKALVPEIKA